MIEPQIYGAAYQDFPDDYPNEMYDREEIDPLLAELAALRQFRDDVVTVGEDTELWPSMLPVEFADVARWYAQAAATIRARRPE